MHALKYYGEKVMTKESKLYLEIAHLFGPDTFQCFSLRPESFAVSIPQMFMIFQEFIPSVPFLP